MNWRVMMTDKFIGNFMGEDVILDEDNDKAAIALIEHQRKEIESLRGNSVDAAMYRLIKGAIQ